MLSSRRRALGVFLGAGLNACTRIARPRPPADSAGVWIDFAGRLRAGIGADGAASPALDLMLSRLALAMFEAANAVRPRYVSYLGIAAAPAGTNAQEAVDAAAHAVLAATFPAARREIDDFYTNLSSALEDGLNKLRGSVVGEHAAGLVLARPALDPAVSVEPYRPETVPGHFVPPGLPDIADFTRALKPWFLPRGAALRPGPPPPLNSAEFASDFNEVMLLGAQSSVERSAGQTQAAKFWASYSWDAAIHAGARWPQAALVDTCRFYALVMMTLLDASVAAADAKSFYNSWRPITAIRNGDRTGNPATARSAGWLALAPTPPDPEYPSLPAAFSGALAMLLAASPGYTADTRYRFDSRPAGTTRSLTVAQYRQIVPESRIWAGSEFRFSTVAGSHLGEQVAALALRQFAPKLS